jgi:hypothetical protein
MQMRTRRIWTLLNFDERGVFSAEIHFSGIFFFSHTGSIFLRRELALTQGPSLPKYAARAPEIVYPHVYETSKKSSVVFTATQYTLPVGSLEQDHKVNCKQP